MLRGSEVTPVGMPAGMVASEVCAVSTEAWLGWPVMTPSELVCVRSVVAGLEYGTVVVELLEPSTITAV
jgi:hypothetical protein